MDFIKALRYELKSFKCVGLIKSSDITDTDLQLPCANNGS